MIDALILANHPACCLGAFLKKHSKTQELSATFSRNLTNKRKRLNNNCLKQVFILRILKNKVTTPPSGPATGPGEASAKWDRAPASSSREKFTAVRPGRRARWALDGLSFAARPRRKAAYVAMVYGFHVQYRGCNDNVIQHNKTAICK